MPLKDVVDIRVEPICGYYWIYCGTQICMLPKDHKGPHKSYLMRSRKQVKVSKDAS